MGASSYDTLQKMSLFRRTWKAFDAMRAALDADFAELDASFGTEPLPEGATEQTTREEETRPDGTRIVRTQTIRRVVATKAK